MNNAKIQKIFDETAYIRTGGSAEERRCAAYLQDCCRELGLEATLESFEVPMAEIEQAELWADGVSIPCKGYLCAGSGTVEAPLYYMPNQDLCSLEKCTGKIVMVDGGMRYWTYHDILDHGALGFITYDGNANYADWDIDQKELRSYVSKGRKVPGVSINAKDAIALIDQGVQTVKLVLKQKESMGESQNVVLDLPGERPEYLALTAHYDSTSLSQGAYDNMSGCVGLLALAEHFAQHPHRYGLRLIWCGSEERGLLGSKAYTAAHVEELEQIVLNINLDMIGCIMGKFIACCTTEEAMVHYLRYLASEQDFGIEVSQDVYSSDSTPFADRGVPAVSFARIAPSNTATIHNRYDTKAVMSVGQMQRDLAFLTIVTERMACAGRCPVGREIPDTVKEKLDCYLFRKRPRK